jgi:uncharacterized membrane protein
MNDTASTDPIDDGSRTVLVCLVVCFVMLVGGYLLKAQCTAPTAFAQGHQYSRLCYNDLQPLYGARAVVDNAFPYIHGEFTADGQLIGGAVEYPVLTGLFLWFTGLFSEDANGFLSWSSVFLAPFGLLAAYFLARMSGWRALMWAASPALIWYSFHNWDLLVVGAVVAGLWSWHRGKTVAAAAWFGIGCALKMYPILFVAPLVMEQMHRRDRPRALKALGAGVGTAVAVNLPFMVANFDGWWATYAFHKVRGPNFDSIWGLLGDGGGSSLIMMPGLNMTVAVLSLVSFGVALFVGSKRAQMEGEYPFLQVAGALLIVFLLWNKVHSPQYTLWLLPFFVVVRVNVLWWVAYTAVDTIAYFGIFRWFYDIVYEQEFFATPAKTAMVFAVWARAALLLVLFAVFLRSRKATGDADLGSLSHPPPKVGTVGDPVHAS